MKILNLKFKNINSLVGENEIDFTQSFFTNEGLFAITGKTGAGKSSILDAISLAFFGKTPRVNITGSENDVMTRGEKDCYSEIEFEVSGKKWKSSWKQELNRNGNLKPVNRLIADSDNKIIADKVNLCDNKISEILGLDFEQFTKVIMLAQGSFAAFLQANNNEKGELLEQITGTEIYAEISKKVFERNRNEKEKLEKMTIELDSIKILSEDEIKNLKDEISIAEKEKNQIDEELTKLDEAKKWIINIENLENQIDEARQKLPELVEKKEFAEIKFDKLSNKLKESKEILIIQEPIFKKVRTIDTQLSEKEKVLKPIKQAIDNLEQNRNEFAIKQKKLNSELEKNQNSLNDKLSWLNTHKKYELLVSEYSSIDRENQFILIFSKEIDKLKSELNKLRKETESKELRVQKTSDEFSNKEKILNNKIDEQKKLYNELISLLNNREISQFQSEKESLTNFASQIKSLIEIEKQILMNNEEIQNFEKKLIHINDDENLLIVEIDNGKISQLSLENKIEVLEENIYLTKTILSLEQHRKNLKDGEECPLCGSLQHPFAVGNMPQLGDKEKELKSLKSQLKNLSILNKENEKRLTKLNADKINNQMNKENFEKSLSNNMIKQKNICTQLNSFGIDLIIPIDDNRIRRLEEISVQNQEKLDNISNIIIKATEYENKIKNYQNNEIPKLHEEIKVLEKEKYSVINEYNLLNQQINSKKELLIEKEVNFKKEYSQYQAKLDDFDVKNIEELKQCLDLWNNNAKNIEEIKNSILKINGNIAVNQNELTNITNSLNEKNIEKKELEIEMQKLSDKRYELFSNKSVDEEEFSLKKLISDLETEKVSAEKEKNVVTTEIEKYNAIIKEKVKDLSIIKEHALTIKTKNEIEVEIAKKKMEVEDYMKKIGANHQSLKANSENMIFSERKLRQKEIQKSVCDKWGKLNELIGSSDGKKYRNFAQTLTFEHLIALSNKQLSQMSDRYILIISNAQSHPFDLSVIDKYQNSEERTAKNLSGGEKFIMSLSLALGLSNMASKNMKIDTMFIDEGFGTLDSDYLDVALNALSNLQSEGKIIGVISHLTELKERIATHIEVVPGSNGFSKIQIKT